MRFQSMVSERVFIIALAALFLLNLADAGTTYYAIDNGISYEHNPFASFVIENIGLFEATVFKVLVAGALSFWLFGKILEIISSYQTCDNKKKEEALLMNNAYFACILYACVFYLFVVAGNTAVILGITR